MNTTIETKPAGIDYIEEVKALIERDCHNADFAASALLFRFHQSRERDDQNPSRRLDRAEDLIEEAAMWLNQKRFLDTASLVGGYGLVCTEAPEFEARALLDFLIEHLSSMAADRERACREYSLARTKLEEARMYIKMDFRLKAVGTIKVSGSIA